MKFKTNKIMTGFENFLSEYNGSDKGVISLIYKDLGNKQWETPANFQRAWDRDCSEGATTNRWSKVWTSFLCKKKSLYARVQQYKIISRWYLTPLKLFHMKAKNDSLCWKGCRKIRTFYHCWWECEKAQAFWKTITFQASKMVSLRIPCSPDIILFDSWVGSDITG